ncbi:MAG: hypothetical protein ACK5LS_12265 [Propioniciclava sp.]
MTSTPQGRTWRPARTSRSARRNAVTVLSIALGGAAIALAVIGLLGWLGPRQGPVQITRGADIELTGTPVFDAGATIFATPLSNGAPPSRSALDCTISRGGNTVAMNEPPPEPLGSRVRGKVSLVPALTLGRPHPGDRLSCGGAYLDHGVAWVLPTHPSRSAGGMAMVIGAVGCLGLAVLTNPRLRGFTPR